ncbi:unnamed protein product [Phytophthora fragariaefolia]|uniref:Unnamed protein product n=1 Tax=Phytophthora fragariaefolia TaxID=1490495 RepID=A0A9W6XSW9_9STRA|nr:unnamed protein product [Phytophthora fragariaefolia]
MATPSFPIVGLQDSPPSTRTLSQLEGRCRRRMPELQSMCSRVRERLQFLHDRVAPLDPEDPVKLKYIAVVVAFVKLLRVKPLLQRLSSSETLVTILRELQLKLSDIAEVFGVADTPEMTEWIDHWEDDRALQFSVLNDLVPESEATMLQSEFRGDGELQRTLMAIDSSLSWTNQAPEMWELKRKTRDRVAGDLNIQGLRVFPWFIPIDDVEFEREPIGDTGTFGVARRGTWTHNGERTDVVVKELYIESSQDPQHLFLRQLEMWKSLDHERILKLHGGSHVSSPPFYVCENAHHGNLVDFLRDDRHGVMFWRLFQQVAEALQFLQSKNIVHGALRCTNILIGANFTAKISDFSFSSVRTLSAGLSKESSDASEKTVRWKPQEVLRSTGGEAPLFASDIYSLAMSMIEAKAEAPFPDYLDDDMAKEHILAGGSHPRPDDVFSDEEWAFVSRLCHPNHAERPTIEQVLEEIHVFAQEE